MRRESHVRFLEGGGCNSPALLDFIVGFQHEWEAKRFLAELRERFAAHGLELHPDKTRLLEFGRFAAGNRKRSGRGKPETFDFLGADPEREHLLQGDLGPVPPAPCPGGALHPAQSEALTRGAGCGKSARPDLWGGGLRGCPSARLERAAKLGDLAVLSTRPPCGSLGGHRLTERLVLPCQVLKRL